MSQFGDMLQRRAVVSMFMAHHGNRLGDIRVAASFERWEEYQFFFLHMAEQFVVHGL